MDFRHVQVLYDLAKDESAAPKDRSDATAYLKANEDTIVRAALELPLANGLKNPHFDDYLTICIRNCMDSPWIRDPKTGRMIQDHSALPESDKIGNVLLAVARYEREIAVSANK